MMPDIQPKYRLIKISTLDFRIQAIHGEIPPEGASLQILHRLSVNSKEELIAVGAGFHVSLPVMDTESTPEPFLSNLVELVFKVFNFNEVVTENRSGQCLIPIDLARVLFSIAIGTARGVCHAKTEGSYLNRFFLPILDAHSIVQDVNGDGYLIIAPNKLAP